MEQKAFDLISKRVGEVLEKQNFKYIESGDNLLKVYSNDNIAYSVFYDAVGKKVFLRTCEIDSGNLNNNWKVISTWLFDPETSSTKEAEDIASDFAVTLQGNKRSSSNKQAKKRKKEEDSYVDDLFLMNRLVTVFPEIKEQIVNEKENYDTFRGVTFAKENIVPKFNQLVKGNSHKDKLKKICKLFNDLYSNGNLDVQGIITTVILNSIDDQESISKVEENLSEELKKAWKFSRKIRGKKIKPEKLKNKKSFITDTLNSQK